MSADGKTARISFEEEIVRLAPADDPNGHRMPHELFRELPTTGADEIKTMGRAGIID